MSKDTQRLAILTAFGQEERHLLQECIHCGFCLPACPTYIENGKEMDSPRGRLYLIDSMIKKTIDLSPPFFEHIDLCLVCRACETACPSGVKFGQLMGRIREIVKPLRKKWRFRQWISSFLLNWVIPSHRWLSFIFGLGWFYQKSGIHSLLQKNIFHRNNPTRFRLLNESLPPIPLKRFGKQFTQVFPAKGEKKGVVALFTGCIMDHLFPEVHAATVRILTWNGYEVVIPKGQTCCGALHQHAGDGKTAQSLININIITFNELPVDTIIVNAAGCGAQLKETGQKKSPSDGSIPPFSSKVKDLSEFLASIPLRIPQTSYKKRVVYDAPCHLIHGQGISTEPKRIIESIPGVTLLTLPEDDYCCGNAGSYTLTHTEMSLDILERKMDLIQSANMEFIITANPGCQIQLQWGVKRRKLHCEVLHLAELLDRAYRQNPEYPK